jgi:hypothetical protein
VRHWIAELWPILATLFLGMLFARVFDILAGERVPSGQGIFSVLLIVAMPIIDMALCRALAAAPSADVAESRVDRVRGLLHAYESVFRRAIHIVVVVGLVIFARIWGIDLFAIAQQGMGGKVSSALLGVCIVLLLAYMLWEGAKKAIDRRLAAERELDPQVPASRLRTVLPLLRGLIAVMDDAFRLGEYIEVGDAKGRVEEINARTLFLRHHRRAINILPYGEIRRLRNINRDWMIMVMDFRLTYDTKKILKQVGDEIAANLELKPGLLQSLKMGGVMSTEDSAIVVRAKFTARPEGEPYVIRRRRIRRSSRGSAERESSSPTSR